MQPSTQPSTQFPSPSMMFTIQSNPLQSRHQSQMHNKRTSFANSIRQQKREIHKKNIRAFQLNFLSSIGADSQSNHTQVMNFVMQEEQTVLVDNYHFDDGDYEDMIATEYRRCVELIQDYRVKEQDTGLDYARFWTKLEQKIKSFLQETQSLAKETITWEVVEKDLEFILQIFSKDLYRQRLQWISHRIILPEQFRLIAAWIYKILDIIGEDYKHFQNITQKCSVLVNLLISFELKIEKETLQQEKHSTLKYDTPIGDRWGNQELFQKVMTLPIMWRKWTQFQHSSMIQVTIYSLVKIAQLIREKLDRIFDTKSEDDHTNLLEQIYDLIYSYHELLESAINREFRWKFYDQKQEFEIPLMKLIAINAQQLIKSVSEAYIWLEIQDNHLQNVSQLFFKTLDHLLLIEKQSERILLCLIDLSPEKSSIPDFLDKQYVELYKKFIKQSEQHFKLNLHFMVVSIKKAIEDVNNSLENFQLHFISNKLQFFNHFIKWACLSNNQKLSLIQDKSTVFKKDEKNQQFYEFLNQIKRRIAMKSFMRLNISLVKKPLLSFVFNEVERIHSLSHLGQIYQNSKQQQYKLSYQLLNIIKNCFLSFQKEFEHFEKIAQIYPKDEDIQRLEANIICQIHLITQILNSACYPDQKSIWKHSYLMAQMITNDKNTRRKKSLVEIIEFIYSRLNKAQCGNIKIYKIKQDFVFLCHNIAFHAFPFQSNFDEFQPQNKQASIESANQFIQIMKKEAHEHDRINFLDKEQLTYIFSEEYLDKQTDIILDGVSMFLDEKNIESIKSGIQIAHTLLLKSPTLEVFKYFKNFIESSTKVYLKIKQIWENHQHDKVAKTAEEFIEDIEQGEKYLFDQDECTEEKDVEI